MNELDHARAMLLLAEKDRRALRGMMNQEVFAEEIFGFHAQQAVENTFLRASWYGASRLRMGAKGQRFIVRLFTKNSLS